MIIKRIDNDNPIINIVGDCYNITGDSYNVQLHFKGKKIVSVKDVSRGIMEAVIENLDLSQDQLRAFLKNYRNFLEKLSYKEGDLSAIINIFSSILGDGNYIIKKDRAKEHVFIYEYLDCNQVFYGHSQVFIALQKMNALNRKVVEKYKKEIKSNKLPCVVVLGFMDEDTDQNHHYYILDGHHKVQAYKELSMAPNVIFFEKILTLKRKIFHYSQHTYIYNKGKSAVFVESGLDVNRDYKDKNFGLLLKRKITFSPTKWSTGVVISKKESELIQKEVDEYFRNNNMFANVERGLEEKIKREQKKTIFFRLKNMFVGY